MRRIRLKPDGRRIKIDLKMVAKLAAIQCTYDEIAAVLDVNPNTLKGRPDVVEVCRAGMEKGKASLRRMQFNQAKTSPAMLIWLGKQYLGQRDIPLIDLTQHYHITSIKELIESVSVITPRGIQKETGGGDVAKRPGEITRGIIARAAAMDETGGGAPGAGGI